jgi:hypothetical protein
MRPAELAETLADLIKRSGHPDVADATVLPNGTLQVDFTNGSTIYAKAAHVAPAKASTPSSPSWPTQKPQAGRETAQQHARPASDRRAAA